MKAIVRPIVGISFAGVAMAVVIFGAWRAHGSEPTSAFWLTLLVTMNGVALGWLIGFLASPTTGVEELRFSA